MERSKQLNPTSDTASWRTSGLMSLDFDLRQQEDHPLGAAATAILATRLAGLEWRAVQAEVGWARMRNRRLYRVVNVLAAMARRPWRVLGLVRELRSALARRRVPVLPDPPSADSYLAEMADLVAPVETRPLPYPHLRIAHAGRLVMFGSVAVHFDLASIDLDRELETGFDMLLIEPGVDDPLDDLDPGTLSRFTEAGVPVLLMARTLAHLDYPIASRVDLILTEAPDLAQHATDRGLSVLKIDPSVDDTVHNPIGWKHHPDPALLVIADHPGIESELETLAPITDQITLHGPAIPGLNITNHNPERPIGSDQATTAKNHLAAYTTPQLTATETSHIQLVLELTAAGTPVITPPHPTLTTLLDGHYLPATTTEDITGHLQTLTHAPTRERHSVPARRHLLTHHTRKHRFEEILTHLDIPINPTPRISILLATKRPENIEHALNNVSVQDWPNKELLLILHGAENFDLDHIATLTSQLPYPTQILPCPTKWTLGDCLNTGLDHATGTYITKMDDDDHYGPHHLTDVHTAHTYSNAHITGKWGNVVYLVERDLTLDHLVEREETFGSHLPGATMLIRRSALQHLKFNRVNRQVDVTLWRRARERGLKLYSTHRFGFVRTRNRDHTYLRGDEAFLARSTGRLRQGLDLYDSMV